MAFILTYYLPQFVFIGDNFKTLLRYCIREVEMAMLLAILFSG